MSNALIILLFMIILVISLVIFLKFVITELKDKSSEQEILIFLFGTIFFLLLSVILGMILRI